MADLFHLHRRQSARALTALKSEHALSSVLTFAMFFRTDGMCAEAGDLNRMPLLDENDGGCCGNSHAGSFA